MKAGWIMLGALAAATALAAQDDPRARLATAQAQANGARARAAALDAQARAALDQAERARAAAAAVAARIQAAEADIGAAEARLAIIRTQQRRQEQRLAAREQPIARLVGALETMARRPVAATLLQPGSLNDLVHVRAVLSTVTPRIAEQTADLRAEVARSAALRRRAGLAVASLRHGQRRGRIEQQQLARLEVEQRRRSAALAGSARLEAERAATLGEQARDLEDLVRRLGTEGTLRERLASLPGPLPRPARLSEALPVEARSAPPPQRLLYRLPVLGPVVRGFGEALPSGMRASGVSIDARPGAIVVAPAAGRVTFAGLYRGYGGIAIVDHGEGYMSIVTGLASNIARIGDTVAAGSPLGRAGRDGVTVELRRDGKPVNPTTLIG
ncbi:peptidoglycan DD-metalloendopeptidase family protein [Sphingomonas sp. MAH-20]|uniref:Peptidoglycan DD-metalloendopeptidase family protein n=2 Tax=Sphingomonadaceae TaxID=41297 RepID=A0A6I4IYB8_9SPHN|nr:peptidoglycan DD-metalloendopeptidase family protein [Sphingomonas sp. CGMCC 1.13658]MVO77135.1 peptidoglycan DD-metalloendopeptidase family protein [Sphingomonas horti]